MDHKDLEIEVIDIDGKCPVFQVGDRIFLKGGFDVDCDRTDALCSHAFGSFLPFLAALSKGVSAKSLGLSEDDKGSAYVRCPDPGPPRTGGGTVTFRIRVKG